VTALKLIPELYCADIEVTKKFYLDVFGFEIEYERTKEQFIYFTLDGVDIMVEGISGSDRRRVTGVMEKPFGRGVNFQWDVADIDSIYARVKALAPESIYLDFEVKSYQCDDENIIQKQFIVQDPDGYLFRFCCEIKT
jgi:catechol 2,3-dioxygenase-like lactoylglutathione lyase family enzyme